MWVGFEGMCILEEVRLSGVELVGLVEVAVLEVVVVARAVCLAHAARTALVGAVSALLFDD